MGDSIFSPSELWAGEVCLVRQSAGGIAPWAGFEGDLVAGWVSLCAHKGTQGHAFAIRVTSVSALLGKIKGCMQGDEYLCALAAAAAYMERLHRVGWRMGAEEDRARVFAVCFELALKFYHDIPQVATAAFLLGARVEDTALLEFDVLLALDFAMRASDPEMRPKLQAFGRQELLLTI